MFDFVQNNQTILKVVLGGVAFSFIGFGAASFSDIQSNDYLARVDGKNISFTDVLAQEPNFQNAKPAEKLQALNNAINYQLVLNEANTGRLMVSDDMVAKELANFDFLQDKGVFSKEKYTTFLQGRNQTAAQFEELIRRNIQYRLQLIPISSLAVSETASQRTLTLLTAQRAMAYLTLSPNEVLNEVTITEEQGKKYYAEHAADFKSKARAQFEYLLLNQDDLSNSTQVSDQEASDYFNKNKADFVGAETRHLINISVSTPKEMPAAEKTKAKAELEALVALAAKDPAAFDAWVKNPPAGTLAQVVDLGTVGLVSDDPVLAAAFALPEGKTSSVINWSDDSLNVVKVMAITPSASFESVKPQVLAILKDKAAANLFKKYKEQLADDSYNEPSSLKPTADKLKIALQKTDWINADSTGAITLANTPITSAEFIKQAFDSDVIERKNNSEVIMLNPKMAIVVRVATYEASKPLSWEASKPQVTELLRQQAALSLIQSKGAALLKTLQSGNDAQTWSTAQVMSRMSSNTFLPETLAKKMDEKQSKVFTNQLFNTPIATEKGYVGQMIGDTYLVVQLQKAPSLPITPGEIQKASATFSNYQYVPAAAYNYAATLKTTGKVKYGEAANQFTQPAKTTE
jgi:peptidyl-prolyl cis-trans isomerase D